MLAESLLSCGIKLIVSSDLQRAFETATRVAQIIMAPVRPEPLLQEVDFGTLQENTWEELEEQGIKREDVWRGCHNPYDLEQYGGENSQAAITRQMEVLSQVKANCLEERVLIVGHGSSLGTLIAHLGHKPQLTQGEYQMIER